MITFDLIKTLFEYFPKKVVGAVFSPFLIKCNFTWREIFNAMQLGNINHSFETAVISALMRQKQSC